MATTTLPQDGDLPADQVWSIADAEHHVTNYLAALAAGAYQQAAWSADNNGVEVDGQTRDETGADAFERLCGGGACAGPYAVRADGPGLMDDGSGQATSTVTVTHLETGQDGTIRLATFEGQLILSDLPPLVPSTGEPTLVEKLFSTDLPARVVVARFDAFEIWEDNTSEWVTNWWAGDAYQVEGEFVATPGEVIGLRDPRTTHQWDCARLMTRNGEVLVLEQCDTSSWRMFEVTSGESRSIPIPFEERFDEEYVWFAEKAGRVVHGIGDAEGNLLSLATLQGVDLLGDDYAGYVALSTDGAFVAYTDHADPATISHFWTPVVVVKDTSTGAELGRWTLDNPVQSLEFGQSWLLAGEADRESLDGGNAEQVALVAINVETGHSNRVDTLAYVFLPSQAHQGDARWPISTG